MHTLKPAFLTAIDTYHLGTIIFWTLGTRNKGKIEHINFDQRGNSTH